MNDSTLAALAAFKQEHGSLDALDTYAFEVVPTAGQFEPLLIEVPSMMGAEVAARRAYFSAMAMLAGQGLDVDTFEVNEWVGSDERGHSGRPVGPGGFKEAN